MSLTRRNFFTQSGLIAAGTVTTPAFIRADFTPTSASASRPRHIIHLVSDGMSSGTLTCADSLSRLRRGRGLTWMELYKRPNAIAGWMDMRSLNSLVTDSSAASSSWGSGSRINNGAVNVLPDGRELKTLYSLFGQAGWKRGLVTTTEITHATPAGFAANDASRGSAEKIAQQYLERKIEVLLGGGSKFIEPSQRSDRRDLVHDYKTAGYHVMRSIEELHHAPVSHSWLGVFSDSHLPYTIDHLRDPALRSKVPTLAEMTAAALKKLRNEPHFILQVEGGRVDHAAHNCDAASALIDQIAFDEALDLCVDFQLQFPETLIVVTTDHGTGNMGLNGMGDNYTQSSQAFAKINRIHSSFAEIFRLLNNTSSAGDIRKILLDTTTFKISVAEADLFASFLERKGKTLFRMANSVNVQLCQLLANYTGVSCLSGAHTSDYVPILALGPGAERFRGFFNNTEVFYNYLAFARIDFKNPSMPLQALGNYESNLAAAHDDVPAPEACL